MSWLAANLLVMPVVLPLLTVSLLLMLGERRGRSQSFVHLSATAGNLLVAWMLLRRVDSGPGAGEIEVYLAANWEAPFGIVLVADRLSALLLVLVGVVALCTAAHAEAAWAHTSVYFRPLLQIQLMGLNGGFLTGDLFNLFVFFEVMLAASYGLQLHGAGWPRVRSGLHYIAVNLLASSLFLVGLAVMYGVLGTLSMADIAEKMALVPERDRGLLHAGAAILAVAFLIKAAIWPLNVWLVPAYTAASAPVAALFALMTKVGIYALLRLWTLFFWADAGASAHFGGAALLYGGLATIAYGALGTMASLRLGHITAFSIITSSGTLLASLGFGASPVTSASLYYLLNTTLAASALFLLAELVERVSVIGAARLSELGVPPAEDTNLDDQEMPLVGRLYPVSMALLGLMFMVCSMLIIGLPPLSGFIAKISLLDAVVDRESGLGPPMAGGVSSSGWLFFGLVLLSGLTATIGLSRAGIRHFWSASGRFAPHLKAMEAVSVISLICCCVVLTGWAEPILRYTRAAAAGLHAPRSYIQAVLSAKALPGPTTTDLDKEGPR